MLAQLSRLLTQRRQLALQTRYRQRDAPLSVHHQRRLRRQIALKFFVGVEGCCPRLRHFRQFLLNRAANVSSRLSRQHALAPFQGSATNRFSFLWRERAACVLRALLRLRQLGFLQRTQYVAGASSIGRVCTACGQGAVQPRGGWRRLCLPQEGGQVGLHLTDYVLGALVHAWSGQHAICHGGNTLRQRRLCANIHLWGFGKRLLSAANNRVLGTHSFLFNTLTCLGEKRELRCGAHPRHLAPALLLRKALSKFGHGFAFCGAFSRQFRVNRSPAGSSFTRRLLFYFCLRAFVACSLPSHRHFFAKRIAPRLLCRDCFGSKKV